MAQRRASSTSDHLTIAGLMALGLTSALVGALVVAPTLAPKRVAMASELLEKPAAPTSPAKSTLPDAGLGTAPRSDSTSPAAGSAPGDLPGVNDLGNGPEAGTGEDLPSAPTVSIRKPGELVGPPLPPGFKRLSAGTPADATDETASDRRKPRDEEKSVIPVAGALSSGEDPKGSSRRRPDLQEESTPSERRPEPASEPARPDGRKETVKPENDGANSEESVEGRRVYRVQSGKFNTREEAQKAQLELAKSGKGGFLVPAGDGFRLQLGVFKSRENAEKAAEAARAQSIMVDIRPERQAQR
jgi:hypothetical protein